MHSFLVAEANSICFLLPQGLGAKLTNQPRNSKGLNRYRNLKERDDKFSITVHANNVFVGQSSGFLTFWETLPGSCALSSFLNSCLFGAFDLFVKLFQATRLKLRLCQVSLVRVRYDKTTQLEEQPRPAKHE
eukprot:1642271-Amphidinium_carterae.1